MKNQVWIDAQSNCLINLSQAQAIWIEYAEPGTWELKADYGGQDDWIIYTGDIDECETLMYNINLVLRTHNTVIQIEAPK